MGGLTPHGDGVFGRLAVAAAVLRATAPRVVASEADDDLSALSLEELMTVEVSTASLTPEPIDEAPATIQVVTARQIADRGYEQLEDALRDLPGIDFVRVQGTFPTLWTLRGLYGGENKRTLLLIDGIVQNNILEGNVLGGPQYSLPGVARAEVLRAPRSALSVGTAPRGSITGIPSPRPPHPDAPAVKSPCANPLPCPCGPN